MTKFQKTVVAALAALASGLTITSAVAAEVRVPVAGKSTEQLHADIVRAASNACWADLRGEALAGYIYPSCVRESVKRAVATIGDAKLVAYAAKTDVSPARYAAR
jgi:hypothetical protein